MPKTSAKALIRQYGIPAEHALYRESGDWFHVLRSFPGTLMDADGYLSFASQADYDGFIAEGRETGVRQNLDTNTLIIKGGISSHRSYLRFADIFLSSGEEEDGSVVTEGGVRRIAVNTFERDASARRRCIKRWGLLCSVCAFDFLAKYGSLGEGYIHVHHLVPVSSFKSEYKLDPERDLRPVCPNCHAMLHRTDPPLSLEELRLRLQSAPA